MISEDKKTKELIKGFEPGTLHKLVYGIYWESVEVIPSQNTVRIMSLEVCNIPGNEAVSIKSVEDAGMHGGRELKVWLSDLKRATGRVA